MIFGNRWLVTMDDAGTEHPKAGSGSRTGSSRRSVRPCSRTSGGPGRRGRHARARQHASPPVPDAHARTSAAGRPLHVAEDALPALGAHRRRDGVRGRARAGSPSLRCRAARRSSTTTTCSRAASTGLVEAEVRAARELGVRLVASRGSMDLGESQGGLPPDSLVEEIDAILADTERLAGLARRRRSCRSRSRRARRSRSRRG